MAWNDADAEARFHKQTVLPPDGYIYQVKWKNDKKPRIVTKHQLIGLLVARRAGKYGGNRIDFTIERAMIGEFLPSGEEFMHVEGKCDRTYCECKRDEW